MRAPSETATRRRAAPPVGGRARGAAEAVAPEGHGPAWREQDGPALAGQRELDRAVRPHPSRPDREPERPQAERAAPGPGLVEVPPRLAGREGERAVVPAQPVDAEGPHDAEGPGRGERRRHAPVAGRRGPHREAQRPEDERGGQDGGTGRDEGRGRRVQGEGRGDEDGGEDAGTGERAHGSPSSRPASRTSRSTRRTGSPATFEGEPSTVSMKRAPFPSTW